jgi:hypothetical protein
VMAGQGVLVHLRLARRQSLNRRLVFS